MPDGLATAEKDRVAVARRLAGGFAARAAGHDRDASFPHENFAELRAAGLLGLTADPAVGGGGAGLAETCAVLAVIGQACPSTALVLAMQAIHVAQARRTWPAPVARRISEAAVRHGALLNALRVEPELGTPARGGLPATIARRTAGGWLIDGHKTTATGAPGLTWMLVFARTDEASPRTGSFLLPASAPGVRVIETWDQLGLRASGSHDVRFDAVAIPPEHAVDLRPPEDWARPDPVAAAWHALTIAALYTGVARAARDWFVGFLRERVPSGLGAPLATLPRMQDAVGAIEEILLANTAVVGALAAALDRGEPHPASAFGLAKSFAAEAAIRAVQQIAALAGNPGLSRRNPLERHLRDVLCARIHTPQADAARALAGRLALTP